MKSAAFKPNILSSDAAIKHDQKAFLMMHLFPSTWVLLHCIPVQGITVNGDHMLKQELAILK